jgi:hypothetical protein
VQLDGSDTPYLIVAEQGEDRAFLGLAPSYQHELSAFKMPEREHTEGAYEAYLYSERGVCRPGETITLNTLLRDSAACAVGGFPVELRVWDPQDAVFHRETIAMDAHGFASIALSFPPHARTGGYRAEIGEPGGESWGETRFNVAHYQPDRIRSTLSLNGARFAAGGNLLASVDAAYYFGRPVADSRVDFRIDYARATFKPEGYGDFTFAPALDDIDLPSRERKRLKTDAAGQAKWALTLPDSGGGGTMRVFLQASVQEPGGRAVSASQRATLFTWPYYLGLRSDWGNTPARGPLPVSWVAVSADGEPCPPHTLRYTLLRREWSYSLREDSSGDMAYRWEKELVEVETGPVAIGTARGRFEIDPEQSGSYVLDLANDAVGVSARLNFALWYGDGGGARPSHPANLVISSDRERYAPGASARLTFDSPTDGVAMITTGAGTIDRSFAVPVEAGQNAVAVVLPDIAQGCAYVAVTIVRPEVGEQLPRRLFGLARLELDQDARALAVELDLPDEARPGATIRVGVSLRANDAPANAQVQLLLVDEGILALTRFASPEPFSFFHGPRRCGLRFGDVYDLLFPDTPERFGQIAAIGGGGGAARYLSIAAEAKAPAVLVLPPRAIEGDGEIEVTLPAHTGALRVMAVAFAADALGGANLELRMRDDLSLLLSGPQAVAPGDKFEITAQVTNHRAANELPLEMTVSGPLSILESAPKSLMLPPGESLTVVARFEAKSAAGVASVQLRVGDSQERISLAVRPPSPPVIQAGYREIPAGQRSKIDLDGEWLAGTKSLDLQISADPNVDARAALSWLRLYPYGCLEQTTSAVFPLAYADGIDPAFDAASLKRPIADTLARLQLMQTSRGGFAMWPGGQKPWFGGSVYASHFLTATKSEGRLLNRALEYLARSVRQVRDDVAAEDRAYGLYVLAAGGKPEHAVAERLLANSTNSGLSRFLAAASLVRGGRARAGNEVLQPLLKTDYLAGKLSWYMDSPARRSALALNVLQDIIPDSPEVPRLLALLRTQKTADGHWGSTQANAMAAMALGQWGRQHPNAGHGKGVVRVGNAEFAIDAETPLSHAGESEAIVIDADPSGPLFASWFTRGVPLNPDVVEIAKNLKVRRSYTDADGHEVAEFAQGDLVTVTVRLSSSQASKDVVVVDLLPGGLQIEDGGLATRWQQADEAKGVRVNFVEKLDDRLLLFCDLLGQAEARFSYQARAVTRGRFVTPRITAEAMYSPDIAAASGDLSDFVVY